MKAITASWMISCALLCGCGASGGTAIDGQEGQPNTPANDSYEDDNHEKPSPSNEFHAPSWKPPVDNSRMLPHYPDPEQDAGPAGEEGNPASPQSKAIPAR